MTDIGAPHLQAFRDSHVGQDADSLMREIASLESYIGQNMRTAERETQEVLRLQRERLEVRKNWQGVPESDPAYRQAVQGYDDRIAVLERQRTSRWDGRTDAQDRIQVLRELVAETGPQGFSGSLGYDVRPPAEQAGRETETSRQVSVRSRNTARSTADIAQPTASEQGLPVRTAETSTATVSTVAPQPDADTRPTLPRSVAIPEYAEGVETLRAAERLLRTVTLQKERDRVSHVRVFDETSAAAARDIHKPSRLRYGSYLSACIIMDLWGFAITALNLTGVALVVTVVANAVLVLFMWVFGRLVLGSRLKDSKKKKKELMDQAEGVSRDVQFLTEQVMRFQKYARNLLARSPQLTARATRMTRFIRFKFVGTKVQGFLKVFTWGPFKYIAENVPFVQALPWWSIVAVALYIEHRGEYLDAQRALGHYQEVKSSHIEILDLLHDMRAETVRSQGSAAIGRLSRTTPATA